MKTIIERIESCRSLAGLLCLVCRYFYDNAEIYAGFDHNTLDLLDLSKSDNRAFLHNQVLIFLEAEDFEAAQVIVSFLKMHFLLSEPAPLGSYRIDCSNTLALDKK